MHISQSVNSRFGINMSGMPICIRSHFYQEINMETYSIRGYLPNIYYKRRINSQVYRFDVAACCSYNT